MAERASITPAGASLPAMPGSTGQPTRRNLIMSGAALVSAAAIAGPALAISVSDPGTRFLAAQAAFNAGTIGEDSYDAAYEAMLAWEPRTPIELTRKVVCLFGDGGSPEQSLINTLVAQGARLVGAIA